MLGAWGACYVLLCTGTLAIALLVSVIPGGPALARQLLHLTLSGAANPPPSVAGALSIAANNTLHTVWPLTLRPLGAHRHRITRALADCAVAANVCVPALLVGGALAGYGTGVLAFLVHVPVEWAGIALGNSAWVLARRRALRPGERVAVLVGSLLVLCVAAGIETWLTPHR